MQEVNAERYLQVYTYGWVKVNNELNEPVHFPFLLCPDYSQTVLIYDDDPKKGIDNNYHIGIYNFKTKKWISNKKELKHVTHFAYLYHPTDMGGREFIEN